MSPSLNLGRSVNDHLVSSAVRHAVYLERYKTGEVNRVLTFLHRDIIPDLLATLESRLEANKGRTWTTDRLRSLSLSTQSMLRAGMEQAGNGLASHLSAFAVDEAAWQNAIVASTMPIQVEMSIPSVPLLRQLVERTPLEGRVLSEWFSGIADVTASRITREISIGSAEGQTVDQIVQRIRGMSARDLSSFTGDGTVQAMNRNIRSVVRTSVNHISTQAKEASYAANTDVISKVQIVATLDARTTEFCMGIDGKTYPINEGPRPPFHFNCRTTTVPVTKSWRELGLNRKEATAGVRASMNGEVSGKLTYEKWLKGQSAEFQDDLLGHERGMLFRRGEVSLDRFADANAKPLTLSQLKELETEALLEKMRRR